MTISESCNLIWRGPSRCGGRTALIGGGRKARGNVADYLAEEHHRSPGAIAQRNAAARLQFHAARADCDENSTEIVVDCRFYDLLALYRAESAESEKNSLRFL